MCASISGAARASGRRCQSRQEINQQAISTGWRPKSGKTGPLKRLTFLKRAPKGDDAMSDYKELLMRLNACSWLDGKGPPDNPDGAEAADVIKALVAENERLREALDEVVFWTSSVESLAPELGGLIRAMHRARAALLEKD
jgi:hypothetical protein